MAQEDFPIVIQHPELIISLLNTDTSVMIGGIWGMATAGQTWKTTGGDRFIWSADGLQVIYSHNGKFYTQTPRGFINDVRTYPAVAAAISAAPWVRVAQIEMKLLMGIVAGASGAGFALVVGMEIAEFVGENAENFEKWEHQLEVILKARQLLKANAPVLYDKVFNAVLKQVYQGVKGNIPDAVTPEIVFFGVGVIIGSVGKAMTKGKFTIAGLIFVVVEQLVVRLTIGVVPQAIKITEDQYRKMAEQIINQLKAAGVTLQDGDLRKIVEEVRQHPDTVKQAFDLMKDAFQSTQAAATSAAN